MRARTRCGWPGTDPFYVAYHDEEWGVPEYDPRALYEKLVLDGFQAGLSWITILRKRENFRQAFDGFAPDKIARYGSRDVSRLLKNEGIIRSRAKIEAAIRSARAWLDGGGPESFARLWWEPIGGRALQPQRVRRADVPAATDESRALSAALKARGYGFCGPTIVYAAMQACGLVNDHLAGCRRHTDCAALADP